MKQTTRKVSCIVCPMSCVGTVLFEEGVVKDVSGFHCPRGQNYAREEVTAPKRMLTTTVRVIDGELPLLPVISKLPLPKDKIIACARCLSTVTVNSPIQEGEVVCSNILNLGVDIVASRDMAQRISGID